MTHENSIIFLNNWNSIYNTTNTNNCNFFAFVFKKELLLIKLTVDV